MKQIITYVFLAFLSYIIIDAIAVVKVNRPGGIVLPLAAPLPKTNPHQVKLYENPPLMYQALARVNVAMHANPADHLEEAEVVKTAQTFAASVGADGIIVKEVGVTLDQNTGLRSFILQGIAISTQY